jgi:hypothetical protein
MVLCAILFIIIGWLAPVAHASYAPQDSFIEVEQFSTEDATLSQDVHEAHLTWTVKQTSTGRSYTELYLVEDDDTDANRVSVESMRESFSKGTRSVTLSHELPEDVSTGTYKYVLIVRMELAHGRIVRTFQFESETFTVSEANSTERFK